MFLRVWGAPGDPKYVFLRVWGAPRGQTYVFLRVWGALGAPRGAKSTCFYVSGAPRGAQSTCFYVPGTLRGAKTPSKNGSKRLEIAIFRWVFVSFLKMGVFSKRLAPLTRQTGKTSRTKRKTSKTLGNIEIFGFWGVLKKRLSIHHQDAPNPSKKTHGSPKISIFLRVFEVFRSVRDVFLLVL